MTPDEYLKLDIEIDETNLESSICRIVERVHPEWMKRIALGEEIEVKPLNGGISNQLFACYPKEKGIHSSDTILFRVYGKNTELFINRNDEIATMRVMHSLGLGSKFYASFTNGICYEYLPGEIVNHKLVTDPNVYPRIAEAIATMHLAEFKGARTTDQLEPGEKIFVFKEIAQLLNLVNDDYAKCMPKMTEFYLEKTPSLKQLKEEFTILETAIKQYTRSHKSLIVFCHNDLLLGNIIYKPDDHSIKIIDYEYAGLNYQAYDIANHFNEFAGVEEPDYSLLPSRQFQLDWVRIYLNSFYSKLSRFYVRQENNDNDTFSMLEKPDDEAIEEFSNQVTLFSLLSHFMWALWSLVQAQNSVLDFDFVRYANLRFDEYFKNRSILFKS